MTIECGHVAEQAGGAVMVRYGDTVVLVAATKDDRVKEGIDFVPLTVDYQEMSYAAGRIPGSFFRREIGRPSEKETLTSRLIDRPIRPLFPKGYACETQIVATVLSVDQEHEPDVVALSGASAALHISNVPFLGPIASVRIGRCDGEFIINPTAKQLEESDMNIVVAGSRDAVMMVEGGAEFASEADVIEAIDLAHKNIIPIIDAQEELRRLAGKEKEVVPPVEIDQAILDAVGTAPFREEMRSALTIKDKRARRLARKSFKQKALAELVETFPEGEKQIQDALDKLEKEVVRTMLLSEGQRIDGRKFDEIRPIRIETGILPRTHGSAIFSRGETQALIVVTLGSSSDEQRIEVLGGESFKSFMLHYNFPPYCVGEVRFLRGPGRREIGHGALAERAMKPVMPSSVDFPYTIRIVSEILSSNGSSSMASVCGASLALMDAGVPLTDSVAGIAMGLIKEGDQVAILSDILGDEDHLGDMDFKVTGSERGITAIQMDVKIAGIDRTIMQKALEQARQGRVFIVQKMKEAIAQPKVELSPYAPRVVTIHINPDKIRDVIGPGGKVIRSIVAETGAKIDIDDTGRVVVMSPDGEACDRAIDRIRKLTVEPEVGQLYTARVVRITDFGAFAEILPGVDGLIHISQLDHSRVRKVTDVVQEGEEVLVKIIEIDKDGRIRLSRKAALENPEKDK